MVYFIHSLLACAVQFGGTEDNELTSPHTEKQLALKRKSTMVVHYVTHYYLAVGCTFSTNFLKLVYE